MSQTTPISQSSRDSGELVASGTQVEFECGFPVQREDDVLVFHVDESGWHQYTMGQDYSVVALYPSLSARIVFAAPPGSGTKIRIIGQEVMERRSSITRNGRYRSQAVEEDLDRLTMAIQEMRRSAGMDAVPGGQPLMLPPGESATLPSASQRAGLLFEFDADGKPLLRLSADSLGAVNTLRWRGPWASGQEYKPLDAVSYNGSSYIATNAHTAALGNRPPAAPWQLLAQAGAPWLVFAGGDTPSDRSASVRALLDAGEKHIVLPAGVYDPLDFNKYGVVIEMEPGVTIRLPNGSSTSADTIAKSALRISAPCCINGSFAVDGNKAGNDGSGLPTSQRAGALDIEADNVCLNGVVHVKDAYFRGLSIGGTVPVKNFNAAGFVIDDPDHYAALLWEVDGFDIGFIRVRAAASGALSDPRIRTGTESSASTKCQNGHIGMLHTEGVASVVIEAHTVDVRIDTVVTANGGKLEDAEGVTIGSWAAPDCSDTTVTRTGFGMSGCTDCHVDRVTVKGFNCLAGSAQPAVWFNNVENCSVGTIHLRGSGAKAGSEVLIRQASGLNIGLVDAQQPNGCATGVVYDAGYPPEKDNRIRRIISRGHTTDVQLERMDPELTVEYINTDAVSAYPWVTAHATGGRYEEGTWTPEYSSSGGDFASVTYDALTQGRWTRTGNLVTVEGNLRTDAIDTTGGGGVVTVKGLPFPVASSGGYASAVVGYSAGFSHNPDALRAPAGASHVELFYSQNAAVAPSHLGTGSNANTLFFSVVYRRKA